MKIKDILGEDGNLTVASVAGDKAKLSNGTEIDAKTLTPDPDKPGQLKAPEMDPNAIKPGAVVTTGDSTSENYEEEEESIVEKHHDTVASGNHPVGGDATDRLINRVRDKGFERAARGPHKSAVPSKLREDDELMKWLTIAGIK
jgi:hypothetical protein